MTISRLDRLLGNLGYGSRKTIAAMAKSGRILLGDVPIKKGDHGVNLADVLGGALTLDGEPIDPPPPLCVMLHKPAGITCSHDEIGPLVYDLLPERWRYRKPALSCAGRLDKASTGQVILTDDGELLHRIIHPKHHAAKRYEVTLQHALRGDEAMLFSKGDFLMNGDDKPLKPAQWIAAGDRAGIMVLQEGRYHQIRRMFETTGNHVTALHRFQIGALALGDLPMGEYRILTPAEIAMIFS